MSDRQYGQYCIKDVIGYGGMATVYRATQESTGRDVALKLLPEAFASDPGFLRRFRREVHLIAQIEHPSIIPVYDYGETDGQPFIVMRLLEGGTLEDRLTTEVVSSTLFLHVLRQISHALDHAHRMGVIHRDVKPSNVLMDTSGNAYLTDFGIARLVGETTKITKDGVMGTPTYMSPEQCQAKNLTHQSDLYSLAIIAFELLAGFPTFDAEKPLSIMYMHVRDPIPSIYSFDSQLPEGLDDIFQKALAKEPEERFQTAEDFFNQIERSLRGWHRAPQKTTLDVKKAVKAYTDTEDNCAAPMHAGFRTDTPEAKRRGRVLSILALAVIGIVITASVLSLLLNPPAGNDETAGEFAVSEQLSPAPLQTPLTGTDGQEGVEEPVVSIYVPGKLVYVQGFGEVAEIITSGADGTSPRRLTSNSYLDGEPDWSRDCSQIVFEASASGNRDLYLLSVNTGVITRLTETPISEANPDWSPVENLIAFEASDGNDSEIFLIGINGEGLEQITDNEYDDRAAQFSPDGQSIAYMSRIEDQWQIRVLPLTDTETPSSFECLFSGCRFPSWSPDGRYLAFNTIDDEGRAAEIWAVDTVDSTLIPLIQGGQNGRPVWASDGEFIFFNRDVDDQPAIYWFNTRSGEIGRFTGEGSAYFAPDWCDNS